MALAGYVANNVVGKLTLKDGTGTPVTLDVPFYGGDISISGLSAVLNEVTHAEARGQDYGLMYGARVYPSVSFSAFVAEMTNASAGVLTDFLMKRGAYSSNVSTSGANRPYTVDIAVHIEGSSFGSNDSDFVLKNFIPTIDYASAIDGDKFTVNGTCGYLTGDLATTGISP